LRGHGEDGDIVEYEWRSQLNGFLGDTETVSIPSRELTIGEHSITLRVKGANGMWSAEVSQVISVVKSRSDGDDDGWLPGMEASVVAMAVVAVVAMMAMAGRRK
ncbi:MAG: hypothetical protein L0Z54_04490, partial [Thermoplasmata archaeon]|nr:hypothetical protein [Thermoplasmata archaeon]